MPSVGCAKGSVFITSTSCPGRSGLGNAYTSVMSATGSASARGPEMWSDIERSSQRAGVADGAAESVRGFLQQRRKRSLRERFGSVRMIEYLLERRADPLGLANLLDGSAVVACVSRRAPLRSEHERLERRQVREPA